MKRIIRIGIAQYQYLEGEKIKRGTLFKEFLYELFAMKSFFFSKCELAQ